MTGDLDLLDALPLDVQATRLRRQLAQHIVRGVPATCLADLYQRLEALEVALDKAAVRAWTLPLRGLEC